MRTLIHLLIAAAATVAACRSEPAETTTTTKTAPGASASAPPSASALTVHHRREAGADAGLDALCKTVLGEEKLDESAMRADDKTSTGPRLGCWSNGHVAWALRVDPADAGSSVKQTILFANDSGARARLASTVDNVEWPPVLGRHSAMFDFDGDGVPEFFTVVPKNVRTYAPASRNFVTFKKGTISPYPTGGGFVVDSVADVDNDGRPDLRVSFELGKRTVCEASDKEAGPLSVELAAHSLPDGKFSVSDTGAAAFAARHCPAMPAADTMFLPSGDPAASDPRDLSMAYVLCARLRGKSADAVVTELNAACAPNAEATKKCSGPCRHLPDALAVAKLTPPVQLK